MRHHVMVSVTVQMIVMLSWCCCDGVMHVSQCNCVPYGVLVMVLCVCVTVQVCLYGVIVMVLCVSVPHHLL